MYTIECNGFVRRILIMRSDDWTRFYDEQYSSYYLYNEKTGESVWEVDFVDRVSESSELAGLHKRSADTETDIDAPVKRAPNTFRSKDWTREVAPLTPAEQTQFDLHCYSRFLYINAALIEAPLTIIEAVIRIGVMFIIALVKLLYFSCRRKWRKCWKTVAEYVREIVLVSAAAVSLAVPGLICSIYWGHSHESAWELRPLLTVIGYVDMRRFAVVAYGGGALASNVTSDTFSELRTEETQDSAPKSAPGKKRIKIKDNNQDSWKGRLMWVPREVTGDCAAFLRGSSDRLDSLDIAL
jgi:hypothetical protein